VGDNKVRKKKIREYLQVISKEIQRTLVQERAPLVTAGVGYLRSMFKEVNVYPHILDKGIAGNPDGVDPTELRAQVWDIVEPLFMATLEKELNEYELCRRIGRASNDIHEVVPAAHAGRVQTLFVARDIERWGRFDPDSEKVYLHDEAEPEDEDLLDLSAIYTLLAKGTVYALSSEKLPGRSSQAAIFRY
jgi:hypothetical protein